MIQLSGDCVEVAGLKTLTEFCPAKINPYLAVTGRRDDGFHELVSVVAPISIGDTLEVTAANTDFRMSCDDPDLPTDGSNLVMQAAQVFRRKSGWTGGAVFNLKKRVPSGAGLGGGSSDAVGALRALNRLSGALLDGEALHAAAAEIGSDCPLFLHDGPVVMRGRGEQIALNQRIAAALSGRELLVVKPNFGVNTAWAYGEMARRAPSSYRGAADAEASLSRWDPGAIALDDQGFNSFTPIVGSKFPAIPAMAQRLQSDFGVKLHMSGSGSACFVWLSNEIDGGALTETIKAGWGADIWVGVARCRG